MPDTLGMGVQAGTQAIRAGLYFGLSRTLSWQARRLGLAPVTPTTRPVPPVSEILGELGQLILRDAVAVRDGIFPPTLEQPSPLDMIGRVRAMLADLPVSAKRRAERDAASVRTQAATEGLPAYYTQDFHFQTGGYLTEGSARLYDIQVEALFLGGAALMRREALRPIAAALRGRDQRRLRLLDVACGTGRFLRDVRLAWPALQLTGLDLSPS